MFSSPQHQYIVMKLYSMGKEIQGQWSAEEERHSWGLVVNEKKKTHLGAELNVRRATVNKASYKEGKRMQSCDS